MFWGRGGSWVGVWGGSWRGGDVVTWSVKVEVAWVSSSFAYGSHTDYDDDTHIVVLFLWIRDSLTDWLTLGRQTDKPADRSLPFSLILTGMVRGIQWARTKGRRQNLIHSVHTHTHTHTHTPITANWDLHLLLHTQHDHMCKINAFTHTGCRLKGGGWQTGKSSNVIITGVLWEWRHICFTVVFFWVWVGPRQFTVEFGIIWVGTGWVWSWNGEGLKMLQY